MAGSSNFLIFNPSLNNSLSDADYSSSLARTNGLSGGVARSDLHNKLFYQMSTFITAFSTVFANLGYTVSDTNMSNLVTVLGNIITTQGGTFTGVVNGITAPQFDNTIKLATTAYVKSSGSKFGSTLQYSSGPLILTSEQSGQLIGLSSAYTGSITLPVAATIPDGELFSVWSGTSVAVTIQRTGTDIIHASNVTVTSLILNPGDTLTLEKSGEVGSGSWIATGGSSQLKYSGVFNSSLGPSGYQRLPSGLIIQWGPIPSIASAGNITITYPIEFPTTVFSISSTLGANNGTSTAQSIGNQVVDSSTFKVYNLGPNTTLIGSYMAIGH